MTASPTARRRRCCSPSPWPPVLRLLILDEPTNGSTSPPRASSAGPACRRRGRGPRDCRVDPPSARPGASDRPECDPGAGRIVFQHSWKRISAALRCAMPPLSVPGRGEPSTPAGAPASGARRRPCPVTAAHRRARRAGGRSGPSTLELSVQFGDPESPRVAARIVAAPPPGTRK